MALPLTQNLNYYRGDTFNQPMVFATATLDSYGNIISTTPVNMTGGSLLAQIKNGTNYGATTLATFTITNFVPASGSFTLNLPASTLATDDTWNVAFYDVQYTDSAGNVTTLIAGEFIVTFDVSR